MVRLRNNKFYLGASRHHPYQRKKNSKNNSRLTQSQKQNHNGNGNGHGSKNGNSQEVKSNINTESKMEVENDQQIQELEAILETFSEKYSPENIKMELISYPVVDDLQGSNSLENDDQNQEKCRFCPEILSCGFDKDEMLHCQECHRIWDGNAQCPCWMSDSDS